MIDHEATLALRRIDQPQQSNDEQRHMKNWLWSFSSQTVKESRGSILNDEESFKPKQ